MIDGWSPPPLDRGGCIGQVTWNIRTNCSLWFVCFSWKYHSGVSLVWWTPSHNVEFALAVEHPQHIFQQCLGAVVVLSCAAGGNECPLLKYNPLQEIHFLHTAINNKCINSPGRAGSTVHGCFWLEIDKTQMKIANHSRSISLFEAKLLSLTRGVKQKYRCLGITQKLPNFGPFIDILHTNYRKLAWAWLLMPIFYICLYSIQITFRWITQPTRYS